MPTLQVDYQDGFNKDTATIHLDGREISRLENITSRMQTGLAKSVELQISSSSRAVTFALPTRGLTATISLPAAEKTVVGVSIDAAGRLDVRPQSENFRYA